MSDTQVIHLGREAITTVLLVAAPLLGFALGVGLLVSLFQATTQIQEQTLVFIPKIIAVFVAALVFGPWMLRTLVEFARNLIVGLPSWVN